MDKSEEVNFIAEYPSEFLKVNGKTLADRLSQVDISEDEKSSIASNEGRKSISKIGLVLLGKPGEIISSILEWNTEVNGKITDAKKEILLEQYFNKADNLEESINNLQEFLTNPQGNTLFNKILRMLDDNPPDRELTGCLSSVLKNMVQDGNFDRLFERHKYSLGQIERLTPQGLALLSDFNSWPEITLQSMEAHGPKVTSDYFTEFTKQYCAIKNIEDRDTKERVRHALMSLDREGLTEAYRQDANKAKCHLTLIGNEILRYLQ